MYLSKPTNFKDSNELLYVNILKDILNDNSMNQKENIDNAIHQAIDIALGENRQKDIYNADNSSYSFIITLLTRFEDKLKTLNRNDELSKDTYTEIIKVLEH
ncbi:hypothetical protein [Tenacibaculum mesophilum]|uniref:hypothetical protein n=1 Tax=Tenacibaculum mesophilum TaxID=104268 RepID=UPI002491566B|nr:hypothetical protein [Tenacibaculum mesophilum]